MMAALAADPAGAVRQVLEAVSARLVDAEAQLNALDRAIGDGDHGSNLARAARNLLAQDGELEELLPGEVLVRAGKAIVMGAGGASGPLYGTLLLELGRSLPAQPGAAEWAGALEAGVAALARRGRSAEGDKTMLDVLAPVSRALRAHADEPLPVILAAARQAGEEGFAAQRLLRARKGRAAYVGDRSMGEDDPGAASALLCLATLIACLAEKNP